MSVIGPRPLLVEYLPYYEYGHIAHGHLRDAVAGTGFEKDYYIRLQRKTRRNKHYGREAYRLI